MVRGSQRTRFTGPALIRLLAQLTDVEAPESKLAFGERLSQWLAWTDAVALSAALNGSPAPEPQGRAGAPPGVDNEFARVRTALVHAIADRGATADDELDFSSHRRRYLARQQAMETSIGPLRARARTALARTSPAMARLAAVDAVMEEVVGAHERRLLATVPGLLEKRFERLRQDAADTAEGQSQGGPWLDAFGKDVQAVLLAELDIRWQPVEGLLEALCTATTQP